MDFTLSAESSCWGDFRRRVKDLLIPAVGCSGLWEGGAGGEAARMLL